MSGGVDTALLFAWLEARSQARGVAMPVPDRGGFRVDTASESETCRWVYPCAVADIRALGRDIREPRQLIKLCGQAGELAALLDDCWEVEPTGYFMRATERWDGAEVPAGFVAAAEMMGNVTKITISTEDGDYSASGYGSETRKAFVYDRIVTAEQYRRQGLARALLTLLRSHKRSRDVPELLVSSLAGHALYCAIGWDTLSTYSTATLKDFEL